MNYLGSKARISKYIVPIIQKIINDNDIHFYIEPFVGGANIIDKIICDKKFGYDIDKYLIYLFIHLKEGGSLPNIVTKDIYDKARQAWHDNNVNKEFEEWEIGCYGHLCSFSGRFFDGGFSYEGIEKRKDGTTKKRCYYQERKNNLLKQIKQPLWSDIMWGISDYRELRNLDNYCIYVDKPYEGVKQYNNSVNFNHNEFWEIIRQWSEKNIVLISELSAPEDFECIWQQEVSRSIKANDKSKAVEKLFVYKEGRQP